MDLHPTASEITQGEDAYKEHPFTHSYLSCPLNVGNHSEFIKYISSCPSKKDTLQTKLFDEPDKGGLQNEGG